MAKRTAELAELLHIVHLLDRRPLGLSGGESQRVALGRALSFSPSTLVLDEPLSALDENTREHMYILLNEVQRHTGVTALHITHSRGEVTQLADLLLLLENGRVRHVDPASTGKFEGVEEPEDTYWS
jgi:ABC-type molybdate transport system ATPase subunit